MKENGGTCSGDRLGVGIVGDKELQGVRVIILAHLGLLFPWFTGLMIENKVPIVMWGVRVLNPKVASRNLAVTHAGPPFYGFSVSPDPAELEDSRGRAPITLCLNQWRGSFRVETTTPCKALLPAAALPRPVSLLPG
ncbi:MAG: hypothetical protein CMN02_00245 [Roseibacillus sp.]|nr:hypothetical protein [Roseibacillus sp.]